MAISKGVAISLLHNVFVLAKARSRAAWNERAGFKFLLWGFQDDGCPFN